MPPKDYANIQSRSVHVRCLWSCECVGDISARGVFGDVCARTPPRHLLCYPQELGKFYKLSGIMSSHESMDDGMRGRIGVRMEADRSQAQVAT